MIFEWALNHRLTEYSKITRFIYIGTNQCCLVHFKKTLLKEGIRADLSLEDIRVDAPIGVDYFFGFQQKTTFLRQ